MDATLEIKAKLPIEELVGQYCQLQKKGSGFVCICPFHQDKKPSMQISPDKGIAYCFACNSGGDIFSFYQKIEGVDFKQALKDLGEKTGVKVEGLKMSTPVQKDHKERIRECLEAAQEFYKTNLSTHEKATKYLNTRGIPSEQVQQFGLGVAPDSFSETYLHLLKRGFSKKEIVDASLGIQKDLQDEKMYDRFRNRLMFPIHDGNGHIVGFGGRTLADDDAKYINSGETPLYNKSIILYGLHHARDAIRERKSVILVEGYFDVLACHLAGITNTVAVSGTALTEQHVKLLKRYAEKVILCLDQDRAGKEAAKRSFFLCSEQEIPVQIISLDQKDPDEAIKHDKDAFIQTMNEGGMSYIDYIISSLSSDDLSSTEKKHDALKELVPLIAAIHSSVEQGHYLSKVAVLLSTTETALKQDIASFKNTTTYTAPQLSSKIDEDQDAKEKGFSAVEIALGIVLLYPHLSYILVDLIEPIEKFPLELYKALKDRDADSTFSVSALGTSEDIKEKASILQMFCEHHGFSDWNDTLALQELKKNCTVANKYLLHQKQQEITKKLIDAKNNGNEAKQQQLTIEYQELLKLRKIAIQ